MFIPRKAYLVFSPKQHNAHLYLSYLGGSKHLEDRSTQSYSNRDHQRKSKVRTSQDFGMDQVVQNLEEMYQ